MLKISLTAGDASATGHGAGPPAARGSAAWRGGSRTTALRMGRARCRAEGGGQASRAGERSGSGEVSGDKGVFDEGERKGLQLKRNRAMHHLYFTAVQRLFSEKHMTRELIENIVDREWSMFDRVRNEGGRASCQNDPATFRIMRTSQFMTWPEDLLRSYLADLEAADRVGRNLLTEKYAFMMESTSPFEFRRIRHMLPVPDQDSLAWIREIVNTHVNWERRTDQAYPRVRSKGRPLTSDEDRPDVTSFETYLAGELKTWSRSTLARYLAFTRDCVRQGRNLAEETADNMARAYGYASMRDAEEKSAR